MEYIIYSVEDDKDISKIINKTLSKQGYIVESFYDGASFFKALKDKVPHMILLDMMLPDYSGSEILKRIRSNNHYDDISIIIVSANNMIMDKVDGLDLGADDYIEKPFDILELMSRVNAKFRRLKKNNILSNELITIDIDKHICTYDDKIIDLTVKEFEILTILLANKGNVVSRDEILNKIWGDSSDLQSRTVDMHIKSIRQKFNDESIIQTVYGVGYKVCL
ncbi:MAG: response regulator transcription factor [Anaeroplasma sp.]